MDICQYPAVSNVAEGNADKLWRILILHPIRPSLSSSLGQCLMGGILSNAADGGFTSAIYFLSKWFIASGHPITYFAKWVIIQMNFETPLTSVIIFINNIFIHIYRNILLVCVPACLSACSSVRMHAVRTSVHTSAIYWTLSPTERSFIPEMWTTFL